MFVAHPILTAGTPTLEHMTLDQRSTIGLILGSEGIQGKLITRGTLEIDHGFDHKTIVTEMRSAQTDSPLRSERDYIVMRTGIRS